MDKYHALLTGSLSVGNMGDSALAKSFVSQHRSDYQTLTILGNPSSELVDVVDNIIDPPLMAIGRRFWNGYFERRSSRKMICSLLPESEQHYVWVGGLMSNNIYHLRGRLEELKWSLNFCNKFIYYFGDIEQRFGEQPISKQLASKLDRSNAWIGVRSVEAAEVLREAGYKSPIQIGIDAAFYARCMSNGLPFVRQERDTGIVSIVVCNYEKEHFIKLWEIAGSIAVKRGLRIAWTSLVDREDLELCNELYRKFRDEYPQHPMEVVSGKDGEQIIKKSSICISTRLHGCIFGITAGVPTIGLPYSDKISRLYRFLGIENWLVYPDRDNLDELIDLALNNKFAIDYSSLNIGIENHTKSLESLRSFIKSP
jgi:polysaccharide pyruvyl transferase WcaK-like protein